jgi:hypothetical protein
MKSYDHFSIGILTENVLSLNNSFNWPNIVGQFSQMNTSTPKSL